MTKTEPPSVNKTAFNCPHCGAFTTQFWRRLYSLSLDKNGHPHTSADEIEKDIRESELDPKIKQSMFNFCEQLRRGRPFQETEDKSKYLNCRIDNLYLSRCYNCEEFTVWVHDKIVYPPARAGVSPNPDLPKEIIIDFEEARSILNSSPRGAAALLRLCIQKLCAHLGERGANINADIASLVSKGLNPLVKQSLDAVRVIGNEAVHPGELDLRDDVETASQLLDLVNAVADQMISHPKRAQEIYERLPQRKRDAIAARDSQTVTPSSNQSKEGDDS